MKPSSVKIGSLTPVLILVASLSASGIAQNTGDERKLPTMQTVVPDPTPDGPINYINPKIPDLRQPEYPGERYEALVLATLDLAERGWLAANANTGLLNPNSDAEMYFTITYLPRPHFMAHSEDDLITNGKFLEVIPLLRTMSGNPTRGDLEFVLMNITLKSQGPDGMLYYPQKGRPWVGMKPGGDYTSGQPDTAGQHDQMANLAYGTARTLGAFCIYAQKDPAGPWREAARRLVEAFEKMTIVEGDKAYLFSTWTVPGRPVTKPQSKPSGLYGGLAGWVANGLVQYGQAVDDPKAIDLAGKLIRYVFNDMNYFGENGKFLSDLLDLQGNMPHYKGRAHTHTHMMNVLPALRYAEQTGDKEILDKALKVYEWAASRDAGSEPLVGFFPGVTGDGSFPELKASETCAISDMIMSAVVLCRMGIDKWDDVDRWTRNHLAEVQITNDGWINDGHLTELYEKNWDSFRDGFFAKNAYTTDNVVERTIGIHAGWPAFNDGVGFPHGGQVVMTCCPGSGARALYLVWRDMISFKDGKLRVNLLMNRASKWADVDSYIPYTGRVEVKVKQPLNLELRIPQWVEPGQVQCQVADQPRKLTFAGRYAQIGPVEAGQTVAMTFPIHERTEKINIAGDKYTVVFRGNEVVSVDPPGKYWPLYQERGHYRGGQPLYKKVTRFVSSEEYPWW